MITRTFTLKEDEMSGMSGWIPDGMTLANVSSGRGIAHDTLEHYVDNQDGFEGEMMALGCLFWGRGISGVMPRFEQGMISDIAFSLRNVFYEEQTIRDPGRTISLDDIDDTFEEMMDVFIPKAIKAAHDEIEDSYEETMKDKHQFYGLTDAEIARRIRGWMRKGIRRSENIYGRKYGLHHSDIVGLFDEIIIQADGRFKSRNYQEGDVLKVQVNLRTYNVKLSVKEVIYER